jgi:hypothetical protein
VTLEKPNSAADSVAGKEFPCPACGVSLRIRIARNQKPYCVCDGCGIQLFFRGKVAIRRLQEIIRSQMLIASEESSASQAVLLYNRIQQLRAQKKELEARQGLIFRDEDLDNAILAFDNEIERVQGELDNLAHKSQGEKRR